MRYLLAALLALTPLPAMAQPAAPPPVTVERLAPGIAFLHARGGNVMAFYGPDGKLLVDDEFTASAPALAAAVDALGPGPIRYVINTHWHGDHTGANALLAARGAVTIGQTNVRLRMSANQMIRGRV